MENGVKNLIGSEAIYQNLLQGQQKKGPVPFFLAVLLPLWHSIGQGLTAIVN
jgi:hypothetical protein